MTKHIVSLLVITVWVCFVYSNSLQNDFHYDDYPKILENDDIKTIKGVFIDGPKHSEPRMISNLTLYLNYKLGVDDVQLYHIFNISLHIINCALVYFIVLLILYVVGSNKSYLAFLTALFFALHPINSEPLNYIVHGRFMILCTMFYLLGFFFFIAAFSTQLSSGAKMPCLVAGFICYILSIFSKEVGVTLPAIIFFYYVYFLARTRQDYIKAFTFLAVALVLVVIYAIWVGAPAAIKARIPEGASPVNALVIEILTQLNVTLTYLKLYVLPLPSLLNVDHYVTFIPYFAPLYTRIDITTIFSIIVIAGLLISMAITYRYNRLASFALLYLFISHSPTTLARKGEFIAEYKNYLPLFGFCLIAVLIIDKLSYVIKLGKRGVIAFVLVIAFLFSAVDYHRNMIWQNDFTLWSDAVSKLPVSARAYNNLGLAYMAIGGSLKAEGKLSQSEEYMQKAMGSFKSALKVYPDYVESIHNIGALYYFKGDFDKALEYALKRLQYDKNSEEAYRFLGLVYRGKGDLEKALYYYEQAYKFAQRQVVREQDRRAVDDLKMKVKESHQK